MARATRPSSSLDFIVIGVQKGGTTTLWSYLRDHPSVWVPDRKEAPYFQNTVLAGRERFSRHLERYGAAREFDGIRGTVSPHYMLGAADSPPRVVAERIAAELPRVKLIAILRDPVRRAAAQYAMERRWGREERSFDEVVAAALDPRSLDDSRRAPTELNTFVTQGEYGRILGDYLRCFEREQLLVLFTDTLADAPAELWRSVTDFLGVDPSAPRGLGSRRLFRSGSEERVAPTQIDELVEAVCDPEQDRFEAIETWSRRLGVPADARREIEVFVEVIPAVGSVVPRQRNDLVWWLKQIWNVQPGELPELPPATTAALREHFAHDAEVLSEMTGLDAPWLESWSSDREAGERFGRLPRMQRRRESPLP